MHWCQGGAGIAAVETLLQLGVQGEPIPRTPVSSSLFAHIILTISLKGVVTY